MMNTEQTRNQTTEIKRLRFFYCLLSIVYCLLSIPCLNAAVVSKTIARVNDDVILQADYDDAVNPVVEQIKLTYGEMMPKEQMDKKVAEIRKELLDQMIDQKLLLQEAKKRDIKVGKREIEKGIKAVKDRFKKKNGETLTDAAAESEFNAELKKQKLTMSQFRDKIREDIMVNNLIDGEVVSGVKMPAEEELKEYYEKNREKIDEPEKVAVRHILIRYDRDASTKDKSIALKKIREVQNKLKKGEDFDELARVYSEDPGSSKAGGELGFIIKGMMVKNFEDTAFKTPVGEISDIFETEFGYHILKVDGKQTKQKRSFVQVKDNLKRYLLAEKHQERYEKFIKTLRDKAEISISEIK